MSARLARDMYLLKPMFTWLQSLKLPGPNLDPYQPQRRIPHRSSHAPYLAIAPFRNRQFNPAGRDIGSVADGWVALPQLWFGYLLGLCWRCYPIIEFYTLSQLGKGGRVRNSFYLYPIGFRHFIAGVRDPVLQYAVIGQQQ